MAGNPPALHTMRLGFLDNLRILASVLVVIHHAARAYARWGPWPIKQPDSLTWFDGFFAVNYAFLMSLFFFIAAYFMESAYDRKDRKAVDRQRFFRMVIPMLFFVLIIIPFEQYAFYTYFRPHAPLPFGKYYFAVYLGFEDQPSGWAGPSWPDIQLAHLWFIEHLVFYGLFYSYYRLFLQKKKGVIRTKLSKTDQKPFPRSSTIILSMVILIGILFTVRIYSPMNYWTAILHFFQVEFAHWPQYLLFFMLGIRSYRHDWIENLPRSQGKMWLILGLLGVGIIYGLNPLLGGLDNPILLGGLRWEALAYSALETIVCFGLIIGLVWLFRDHGTFQTKFMRFLSQSSYLVYLIHQPIVVLLQYLLFPLAWHPFVKFMFVAITGLGLSFGLSGLIRNTKYGAKYL